MSTFDNGSSDQNQDDSETEDEKYTATARKQQKPSTNNDSSEKQQQKRFVMDPTTAHATDPELYAVNGPLSYPARKKMTITSRRRSHGFSYFS